MKRRSLKSLVFLVYNSMMLLFGCYDRKVWADKSQGLIPAMKMKGVFIVCEMHNFKLSVARLQSVKRFLSSRRGQCFKDGQQW